jgi:hypothetical protein
MIDQRIKEHFAIAVRLGREVAEEETVIIQAEHRLRLVRAKLEAAQKDLLLLLPKSANKARLSFALCASATGESILESISLSS